MKTTNVIIVTKNGIFENPIVCNCDTRAGMIYVDEAQKLGVELDEEEVQKMGFSDCAISRVMREVEEQLEGSGNELKWFEADILKQLK